MITPALCRACARYTGKGCASFPEGIPDDIAVYGGDHRQSIAGEPPFEQAPGRAQEYADWLAWHDALPGLASGA